MSLEQMPIVDDWIESYRVYEDQGKEEKYFASTEIIAQMKWIHAQLVVYTHKDAFYDRSVRKVIKEIERNYPEVTQ